MRRTRFLNVWFAVLAAGLTYSSASVAQTPEQTKMWEAERAQAQAEEKIRSERLARELEARRADPMAWVHTLDPMSSGGWVFRAVAADGSWATFSTEHQLKRSGRLVTSWLRREYPEAHRSSAGDLYSSEVEKVQYDCAKERARVLLTIYYTENNLAGSQQSEAADPKLAEWESIVPGTQGETDFRWNCGAASAGSRPRQLNGCDQQARSVRAGSHQNLDFARLEHRLKIRS